VVDHVTGPTNFLGGYVSFAVSPEGSEALVRNGAQWSRWVPASGAVTPLPGPCAILSSAAWATQVRLVVDGVGVCTGPNATPQAPVGQYSRLGLFNARQSGGHVIVTNSAGATVSDIVSGATPAVGSVADNGAVLLPTPGGPGIFAPGTAAPKFAVNAPTSAIISPDGGYIVWTTGTDASGRFGVEVNSSATATDQIATLPGQASCYRNTVGGSFVWPLYLGGCAA
jgi:hypothetical protein